MFQSLRFKLALLANRFRRRRGHFLPEQCASVIMRVCSLQLERNEIRELAPTQGAFGPMMLSGGAITTIRYRVFDPHADRIDKSIRQETTRAFAQVVMRLQLESDPECEAFIDGKFINTTELHRKPGLELVRQLSQYFPLLPRPFVGRTYSPPPETLQ